MQPSTGEVRRQTLETLQSIADAAQLGAATKGFQNITGQPSSEEQTGLGPTTAIIDMVMKLIPAYGELMKGREEEARQAKAAQTEAEKEIHEIRAQALQKQMEDIERKAQEAYATQQGGVPVAGLGTLTPDVQEKLQRKAFGLDPPSETQNADIGTQLGVGPLHPEVLKEIQKRALGIPTEGGNNEHPSPAFGTPAWFEQWVSMKPAIEGLAQMVGFVPREEGIAAHPPRESMGDKELELGIHKLDLEFELDKVKVEREHAKQMKRLDALGDIGQTVKENISPALIALGQLASGYNAGSPPAAAEEEPSTPELMGVHCQECGDEFAVTKVKDQYTCPFCSALITRPGPPEQGEATVAEEGLEPSGPNGTSNEG